MSRLWPFSAVAEAKAESILAEQLAVLAPDPQRTEALICSVSGISVSETELA